MLNRFFNLIFRRPSRELPVYLDLPDNLGVLAHVPQDIRYLMGPALRYGIHQDQASRVRFLESATGEELSELKQLAAVVRENAHFDEVTDFFDEHPVSDNKECALLEGLFGVMDQAGYSYD